MHTQSSGSDNTYVAVADTPNQYVQQNPGNGLTCMDIFIACFYAYFLVHLFFRSGSIEINDVAPKKN